VLQILVSLEQDETWARVADYLFLSASIANRCIEHASYPLIQACSNKFDLHHSSFQMLHFAQEPTVANQE
jgi:hypothetical protein